MKRWIRRLGIALAVAALTLGILYECATHVGRGWLCGEAFYDGRPTSWWRARIDRWVATFETPSEAEKSMRGIRMRNFGDFTTSTIWMDGGGRSVINEPVSLVLGIDDEPTLSFVTRTPPAANTWQRLRQALDLAADDDAWPPYVLNGLGDAESVLRELEADDHYRPFTQRARRNAAFIKRHVAPDAWKDAQ